MGAVLRFVLFSRAIGFAFFFVLLLAWQVASGRHLLDPVFVPPPSDILRAAADSWRGGQLPNAILGTLVPFAQAFACAVLLGVTLGLLMGYWRVFYALLEPTVELLRPIPPPAIVPLAILLLGIEDRMKIAVSVFASVFPVLLNTVYGVRGVDSVLIDTARTFGYGRPSIAWRIILPAALPSIFAGMRISLAIVLIGTVVSEMVAGTDGIGFFILDAERAFRIPEMYAGVLTVATIGYALNSTFLLIERSVIRWHVERSV
jgi:ABC-type nitrate/sulfonate/bicarbonate transport system permease component